MSQEVWNSISRDQLTMDLLRKILQIQKQIENKAWTTSSIFLKWKLKNTKSDPESTQEQVDTLTLMLKDTMTQERNNEFNMLYLQEMFDLEIQQQKMPVTLSKKISQVIIDSIQNLGVKYAEPHLLCQHITQCLEELSKEYHCWQCFIGGGELFTQQINNKTGSQAVIRVWDLFFVVFKN